MEVVVRLAAVVLSLVWGASVLYVWWVLHLVRSIEGGIEGEGSPSAPDSFLAMLGFFPVFAAFALTAPLAAVILWRGPAGRSAAIRASSWALVPIAGVSWLVAVVQVFA